MGTCVHKKSSTDTAGRVRPAVLHRMARNPQNVKVVLACSLLIWSQGKGLEWTDCCNKMPFFFPSKESHRGRFRAGWQGEGGGGESLFDIEKCCCISPMEKILILHFWPSEKQTQQNVSPAVKGTALSPSHCTHLNQRANKCWQTEM